MKQPPSTTARRVRWRALTSRVLVTAAVLALGLAMAPVATAAPAAQNLGSVGTLTVDLDIDGAVPWDMGRSGAGIRFESPTASGTCLTNGFGWCQVRWTSGKEVGGSGEATLSLPTGTYTVTQPSGLSLPGLAPRSGDIATVTVCQCSKSKSLRIVNDSLYRDTVTAHVVDAATGNALTSASFRLTGPGGVRSTDRSDKDGRLSFSPPFPHPFIPAPDYRPGAWTLTPLDLPGTHAAPVSITVTAADVGTRALQLGTLRLGPPAVPPVPPTGSATLTVQPSGSVPAGLDLSGAEFELTSPSHGGVTGTCVTGPSGSCAVAVVPGAPGELNPSGESIALPPGRYSVRQTKAPTGLAVAEGIADQQLCVSTTSTACTTRLDVANASLFRTSVQAQVRSGGTAADGVDVVLTGPGYVATAPEPGPQAPVSTWPTYEAAPLTTAADGLATWTGWFLPGEWRFAVEGEPEPLVATMTADPAQTWQVAITLVPSTGPGDGTGTGTTPPATTPPAPTTTPPATTPPAPTTSPAEPTPTTTPSEPTPTTPAAGTTSPAAPTSGPGTTGSPTTAAPTASLPASPATGGPVAAERTAPAGGAGTTTGGRTPGTGQRDVPEQSTAPATPTEATAASDAPSGGSSSVVVLADDAPDLRTESATELLPAGLVAGVGGLFVTVVLAGYGLMRARARRRV